MFKILEFFLPIRVYPLFLCRLFSNLSFYLSVYFKIIQFSHGSYFKFTFSFFTFFFIFDRRKLYFFAYIFWTLHPIFLSESLQFFFFSFFYWFIHFKCLLFVCICIFIVFVSFFYRFSSLYCDIFSSPTFSIRILTPAFLLFNLSGAFSAPHLVHFRPPLKSLIKISCCCRFPGLPIWEPVWTLPRPLTWPHLLVSQPADLLSMLSQSSYDSIVE